MAKLKKFVSKQNLDTVRVLIEDNDPSSRYFQIRDLSDVLHSGRQGFLVGGSPALINDTEVLIEILDSNGNPVFVSAVRNYAEGQARFITIEVYEDTPPGIATLTMLGEAAVDLDGNEVPAQWRGAFNVKYQRQIQIDPLRTNDSKIRVFKTPNLIVSELLVPFRKAVTGSSTLVIGSGSAIGNTLIHTINPANPTPNIYTIVTAVLPLSKSYEGGSFTASISESGFTGIFTSSIASVLNDSTFEISPGVINNAGTAFIPFGTSNFTISFAEETQFSPTTLIRSFADAQLVNLKTFSGDIARTKLFMRTIDSEGDFELITDKALESQELTETSSVSLGPVTKMGDFSSQEVVDEFWVGGTITQSIAPPYVPDDALVITSRNTNQLIDSIFISNAPELKAGSGSTLFPTKFIGLTGSVALPFIEGLEYQFNVDALCLKDTDDFVGKLTVYLSGSAFPSQDPLGVKITELIVSAGVIRNLRRNTEVNFVAPKDGTAKLQLVVTAGEWYLSNLSIISAVETGFNPDCAEFLIPVVGKRFEQLQFKAQIFDPNNNVYPEEIFSDIVFFNGGNLLLRGTDHRIEGTLTISPSGSGVTISSEGYFDTDGTPISGSAIFMGEGRVFHSGTAVLLAEDPDGDPEISFGDKLHGFVDPTTGDFILIIVGTILVGSGSDFTDIRSLLPRSPSDGFFHRVRGFNLDFYDVQGKKALTAGDVQSDTTPNFISSEQIARMGKYTRGSIPRTVPTSSPLIVPGITGSLNPFSAPTVTTTISSSGVITVPTDIMVWNNTLYGNITVDIDEVTLDASTGAAYEVSFELIVDTSWVGFASGSQPGLGTRELNLGGTRVVQTIAVDDNFFITKTGSFSPDPYISYPIHIPEQRPTGFTTLYVLVSLQITTTQA